MKYSRFPAIAGLTLSIVTSGTQAAVSIVDFEDIPLAPESYYNGSDGAGQVVSRGATFENSFTNFGSFTAWNGFSASNTSDTTTPGFSNQYSAITGSGFGGSGNYGISFIPSPFSGTEAEPKSVQFGIPADLTGQSMQVTNTTYAYLSMLNGDGFAKKFGGASGDDPDFFLLTIEGFNGASSTGTIEFHLADFRFANNSLDYIIDDWTAVDLSSLGTVTELSFELSSSDNSPFGMNTPGYFALDNMPAPEPGTSVLAILATLGFLRRKRS